MRSIRLWLVVSFLVLLSAALGVIGVVANRTMAQALHERNEKMREVLSALRDSRQREADEQFDERIYRLRIRGREFGLM